MDDRTLVEGLLHGDPQAQSYLDRTYRPKLHRACCHLLGYRDSEAEDVVQEVFLAIYRQAGTFEFRSSFYHWIYRICMYQCYEVVRKRRRQVATLDTDLEGLATPGAMDRSRQAQESSGMEEALQVLRTEREALGEPCRGMLVLRDVEGRSYAAIAEALKIPIGTVMSRLARCKESLLGRVKKRLGRKSHG